MAVTPKAKKPRATKEKTKRELTARLDKEGKELPEGVYLVKSNSTKQYKAQVHWDKKEIYVGYFVTPELAYEGYLKRKAELEANPESANRPKLSARDLPKGVFFEKKNKTNQYKAMLYFNKKHVYVGNYNTSEAALIAIAVRKAQCQANPASAEEGKSRSRGLPKGVYHDKTNKANPYQARINFKNKDEYIDNYPTAELALEGIVKRRAEFIADPSLADHPKPYLRDLPMNVKIANPTNKVKTVNKTPYKAEFQMNKMKMKLGTFATSALAAEAIAKRRAECEADPSCIVEVPKVQRALPKGVYHNKSCKTTPFRAKFNLDMVEICVGNFATAELAFAANAKRRAELTSDPAYIPRQKAPRTKRKLQQGKDGLEKVENRVAMNEVVNCGNAANAVVSGGNIIANAVVSGGSIIAKEVVSGGSSMTDASANVKTEPPSGNEVSISL